jgi:hypothetical protein
MKEPNTNHLISETAFRKLAAVHDRNCVSIFVPTHRAGLEVDSGKDRLILKKALEEMRKRLEDTGLKPKEVKQYADPLQALLKDDHFMRNQSDGLAIFIRPGEFLYYTLPVELPEFVYVSDHFYLKEIIPYFTDDGRFYLLSLSLKQVKCYECTRHQITELAIEDLIPENLEAAVGHDYQEKSLQHRSGQGGEAGAMFHGQGSGKDDKQQEIEKFFRAVDGGLAGIWKGDNVPLVLACVDSYPPIFREITKYPSVYEQHISGNPDNEDPILLHEKAWNLLEQEFRQPREEKIEDFHTLSADTRTSHELETIIPAAVGGRVDTLFLLRGADVYGKYDPFKRHLEIADPPGPRHASLYNLAALQTILNGGRVYLAEPDRMPFRETQINALFRY